MSIAEPPKDIGPLEKAFATIRSGLVGVGLLSFVINLLMLTGPLFMLQVYDRVLASGSVPTLVVISIMAMTLYVFYGLLEVLRSRILSRLGQRIDSQLSEVVFSYSNILPLKLGKKAGAIRPANDLDVIRKFFSGPGPGAICDIPWLPFYLAIVYLFHPVLGLFGLLGAVVICILIGLNEVFSKKLVSDASTQSAHRAQQIETGQRNAEAIAAMGLQKSLSRKWEEGSEQYLTANNSAADRSSLFGTAIKTFRFILQSGVLAIGAWLALSHEISPGVMIAASIMISRALAPVEQAVGQWRNFIAFRQSSKRLREGLGPVVAELDQGLPLPLPERALKVEYLACGPVGETSAYVKGVSFELEAGDGLGVIGTSGSGKSTLARALVGVVPALSGDIRFDGTELSQWNLESRGKIIGYLPQNVQLFDGTIAENIARFEAEAELSDVIEAAKCADVHELVTSLPKGYETRIGKGGRALSAGQNQRIALARALYGKPFLVVLDEPNSNLDSGGEAALTNAIKAMRQMGSIVIVIAHRPSAISATDKILCMKDGVMTAFGDKKEVLQKVLAPVPSKKVQADA